MDKHKCRINIWHQRYDYENGEENESFWKKKEIPPSYYGEKDELAAHELFNYCPDCGKKLK